MLIVSPEIRFLSNIRLADQRFLDLPAKSSSDRVQPHESQRGKVSSTSAPISAACRGPVVSTGQLARSRCSSHAISESAASTHNLRDVSRPRRRSPICIEIFTLET